MNLRIQVSRGAERKRYLVAGLLLEARRQVFQRVIQVGGGRDRDVLGKQRRQEAKKQDEQEGSFSS